MCLTNGRRHSFVLDFSFVSFLCIRTKKKKGSKITLYWFEETSNTTDIRGRPWRIIFIADYLEDPEGTEATRWPTYK